MDVEPLAPILSENGDAESLAWEMAGSMECLHWVPKSRAVSSRFYVWTTRDEVTITVSGNNCSAFKEVSASEFVFDLECPNALKVKMGGRVCVVPDNQPGRFNCYPELYRFSNPPQSFESSSARHQEVTI